jgi:hypothetical protein
MTTKPLDAPLKKRVARASRALGVPEHEIVRRAVTTYLDETADVASLFQELRAWDNVSAASMRRHAF